MADKTDSNGAVDRFNAQRPTQEGSVKGQVPTRSESKPTTPPPEKPPKK